MIIAKFGGKSVATVQNIKTISRITKNELSQKPVIVVSALSQVTNMLIELSNTESRNFDDLFNKIKKVHIDLIDNLWDKKAPENIKNYIESQMDDVKNLAKKPNKTLAILDKLMINGELMSSFIIAHALTKMGIDSRQVVATDLIVTDTNFGSAEFITEATIKKTKDVIEPLLSNGIVPVVTGFMGATAKGDPTTLGRGGSDYSAAILGLALEAKEIQIWTDVDGVFSADPHLISNAILLNKVSFMEASELSFFGAKILHPRTMRPARRAGIPMRILNTLNPESKGTIIDTSSGNKKTVKAITFKKSTKLINLYSTEMLYSRGFLAQIFSIFALHNISVDLVGVSEVSVSVTLDNHDNLKAALSELSEFTQVTNVPDFGIVSLIGEEIVNIPHIMQDIFSILEKKNIKVKMISLSATDVNISLVIKSDQVEDAVKYLHDHILLK